MILDQNKVKTICDKYYINSVLSLNTIRGVSYSSIVLQESTPFGLVTLITIYISEFANTNNLLFHNVGEYKSTIDIEFLKEIAQAHNSEGMFIFLTGRQPLYKRLISKKINPVYTIISTRTKNENNIFYIKFEE